MCDSRHCGMVLASITLIGQRSWCAQVATHKPASSSSSEESNASSGAMFGILCLGAALVLKAIGGAVQEKALKSYGSAPEVVNEMIFWQSLLVALTLCCAPDLLCDVCLMPRAVLRVVSLCITWCFAGYTVLCVSLE